MIKLIYIFENSLRVHDPAPSRGSPNRMFLLCKKLTVSLASHSGEVAFSQENDGGVHQLLRSNKMKARVLFDKI